MSANDGVAAFLKELRSDRTFTRNTIEANNE